ncbi:hypothetical protein CYMTET_30538 [Cymbomonas tetramitiformis]|uniref:Uncharacterized protein n=1 Tax=Cymbomonas tetramitiformis TaxID=36881 RepID=A0AAE0FIX5_9CHLO|nr:hypothetical protein CYMTET_30538 [Cymbomonas tetramitiformis]
MLFYHEDRTPHKFNMRIYVAAISFKGEAKVHWYIYHGGYVGKAIKPWMPMSTEKEAQISRDRAKPFREWEGFDRGFPIMLDCVREMLVCTSEKFKPPSSKAAFELFGTDIMLDDDWRPFLLEVNRSPRVLDMDRPVRPLSFG